MADTKRTAADLLTNLFQDGQAPGSITPQDMRDLIESMKAPCGGQYYESNATVTTLTAQNTWYKVAGTTSAGATSVDMDVATTSNKLIYTGTPDRHFRLESNFSFICSGNNQEIQFAWKYNGATMLPAIVSRFVATGADVGSTACHADKVMSTNDYVELFARNVTGASTTITVKYLYLFGMGFFS